MSIKVLQGGDGYRHTFQDDMESFFYVVLYAALRWLPHNHIEELGNLMSEYFNEYREHDGTPLGGRAKASNITFGDFTKGFKWENGHLATWFNDALQLQRRELLEQRGLFWTPEALKELWKDINSKDLPNDDRIEHKIVVDSEEIKEEEYQATSSGMHYEPSARLYGQSSGQVSGRLSGQVSSQISGNISSSAQFVSAIAGSSLLSLGKRSTTDMEEEGSEESGMSRDSKRRRSDRIEEIRRANRVATGAANSRAGFRARRVRRRRSKE